MDFHTAIASVTADLTPQPWTYTTHDGGITLTVVPAGLREDPGFAEVILRIGAIGQFFDVEACIPSREMPALIDALTGNRMWSYDTDDVWAQLTPFGGGGMLLTISEDLEADDEPQVHVPEGQRMPLASALRRALDVARGWES
ncbi:MULTISPECIES: hypothetical protein [Streptomyces]|uniref:hypothetical protein n=1 Tax=Streptomyces TaxID=1883 RepID=UPI0006AFBC65|nr:hypothetical protein [Streptomyces sp. NRRL F-4707]KOX32811.1 hypothetical protein ADL07_11625 [Streptomyces sp. NRRL F-4707]